MLAERYEVWLPNSYTVLCICEGCSAYNHHSHCCPSVLHSNWTWNEEMNSNERRAAQRRNRTGRENRVNKSEKRRENKKHEIGKTLQRKGARKCVQCSQSNRIHVLCALCSLHDVLCLYIRIACASRHSHRTQFFIVSIVTTTCNSNAPHVLQYVADGKRTKNYRNWTSGDAMWRTAHPTTLALSVCALCAMKKWRMQSWKSEEEQWRRRTMVCTLHGPRTGDIHI